MRWGGRLHMAAASAETVGEDEGVMEGETPLGDWLAEHSLPVSLADAAGVASVEQLANLPNAEIDSLAGKSGNSPIFSIHHSLT